VDKVFIAGLGDLGGWVLEFLVRTGFPMEVVTADKNEEWGVRKTNGAVQGALQMGFNPRARFIPMDFQEVDATAEVLEREKPDIVYNSLSLQSWWVITQLPKSLYDRIDQARYGPWLPMHLALTERLMRAIKMASPQAKVVNAAFPDAVNPILAKVGLAPEVGIGNVDNVVPALKELVARKLGLRPQEVDIYLLAPHYVSYQLSRFGSTGGAPCYLRILVHGSDVTGQFDRDDLFRRLPGEMRRPGGREAHPLVASSVLRIIMGILRDAGEMGHAPGPEGLPGGYPVRMTRERVEAVMPPGISRQEAIRLNEEAQRFDGIEEIREDGSVRFGEAHQAVMREVLGYDCPEMRIEEAMDRAQELSRRFASLVRT